MIEAGVSLSAVASIMGWSPSTMVLMSKRYGHIGPAVKREAVDAISGMVNKVGTDGNRHIGTADRVH
jgi:hypothetical protein